MSVNISLDLAPEWGTRAASAQANLVHTYFHFVEEREGVAQAEGDAFQNGADHVGASVRRGQADEGAASVGIKVRSALAHQIGSPQKPPASGRDFGGFVRQAFVRIAAIICASAELVAEPAQRK